MKFNFRACNGMYRNAYKSFSPFLGFSSGLGVRERKEKDTARK